MATVYEIVQGIHQAAANAYDGAHDKKYSSDGEDHKVGLKREEGDCIVDSRVMDGFNVRVSGNTLMLSYQAEIKLKEFHDNSFEDDVESTLNDIVKFLKKEYKKVTGDTLSLSAGDKTSIHAQSMSRVRSWIQATKTFKIGGMKDVEPTGEKSEDRLDGAIKSFLELGREKAKKPQNVKV